MWRLLILLMPWPALADSLVAARTIRAQTTLGFEDVSLLDKDIPGALQDAAEAVGRETRVAIYAGRPIMPGDLGPSAIVERNQVIPLSYAAGGLLIRTEGRALSRGGVGETIEVLNLSSHSKVAGRIGPDGVVRVGPEP